MNRQGVSRATTRAIALALAIALGLVVAACGGSSDDAVDTTPAATGSASSAETFDRAFIDAMVPHHEMAIEMARAAKDAGLVQPDLIQIADAIVATQQSEIDQMKAWRGEWFGSSEIDPAGAAVLGMSETDMGMQHDPADFARADDVDQAFALAMIDHHNGAIEMAQLALGSSQRAEIRDLAQKIIDAQQREVEIMRPHATGAMQHG